MPPAPQMIPIVLISSTKEDLIEYRSAAYRVLIDGGILPKGMEAFGTSADPPKQKCLQTVRESHAYIGIFGMRYGSIDPETGKSYTHLEYEEARRLGRPLHIYLVAENHPVPASCIDLGENAERLKALKDELCKHTVSWFTTPEDLALRIALDIPRLREECETAMASGAAKEVVMGHGEYVPRAGSEAINGTEAAKGAEPPAAPEGATNSHGSVAQKVLMPEGWAKDRLSAFISDASDNTFNTFLTMKEAYRRLSEIHEAFMKLGDNLTNTPEFFSPLFIPRAHAYFLGGLRLAMSGQLSEAYLCLWGCLEHALYGFYFAKHPDTAETFLRSKEDGDWPERASSEFAMPKLLGALEQEDRAVHRVTKALHDQLSDYGAHPNPAGLLMSFQIKNEEKRVTYTHNYFNGEAIPRGLCLKTVARVGVCVLDIFKLTLKQRFAILGLDREVDRLRKGL